MERDDDNVVRCTDPRNGRPDTPAAAAAVAAVLSSPPQTRVRLGDNAVDLDDCLAKIAEHHQTASGATAASAYGRRLDESAVADRTVEGRFGIYHRRRPPVVARGDGLKDVPVVCAGGAGRPDEATRPVGVEADRRKQRVGPRRRGSRSEQQQRAMEVLKRLAQVRKVLTRVQKQIHMRLINEHARETATVKAAPSDAARDDTVADGRALVKDEQGGLPRVASMRPRADG